MRIEQACQAFSSRCAALNLAEGTLGWYGGILRRFASFLGAKGVEELSSVHAGHLRELLNHLRQKGQSSQTVSRTYGALRCVFRFWSRERILRRNPMDLLERPRKEHHLIKPLSVEQAAALLEQPSQDTLDGLRDRALMMLILDSGLRISEALSLEGGRIDAASRTLVVLGKGRKERSVPFSALTLQALRDYSRLRDRKFAAATRFFVGRTGQALDRTKAGKLIRRYGARAGIEGVRVSPHTLRHTFAVLYIRNGGDAFSLQEILGHSTLEMTRAYVHLARRDVAEQHRKFSPVERLLGRAAS